VAKYLNVAVKTYKLHSSISLMVISMPETEKDQVVTSLRVDPELWKKAKMKAIENDTTLGEIIDEALREWIKKQEKTK